MLDRIAGNEALAKHIVVFRPNGKLNCETQYFGPFTFDDAYEYLDTKLPAIGICPEGENAGVKFIQELVRAA